MLSILSFIFGASVGSFVQVIASRLNVAPIIKGRSKCLSCGEALRASDLIPVVSYLLLQGKCRYCKSKYGIEALIIELIFGTVFLLIYQMVLINQPTLLVSTVWLSYYTLLFGSLGVMALYDKVHSYIPMSFLLAYIVLTFTMYFIRLQDEWTVLTALSPIFVALPFLLIWVVSRGKALGFGDIILFLGVGAFFGSLAGFAVFILSIWAGAIVGLYVKYGTGRAKEKNIAIPFVPFIALSFVVVLFTGIDVFSIASLFS